MSYEGVDIDIGPLIPWLKSLGFWASLVQNPYMEFPDMIDIAWRPEAMEGGLKGDTERHQAYPVDWCHKIPLLEVPLHLATLDDDPKIRFSNLDVEATRKILSRRLEVGI
jgi:hypothetical protein